MVPLFEKYVPDILNAIIQKIQKHKEVVPLYEPEPEPMMILERMHVTQPVLRGPVPQVKFYDIKNHKRFFETRAPQLKFNEKWSVLDYSSYNEQSEIKIHEGRIQEVIVGENKEVQVVKKKKKKNNKTAKKLSKKLERLHRFAQSNIDKKKKHK